MSAKATKRHALWTQLQNTAPVHPSPALPPPMSANGWCFNVLPLRCEYLLWKDARLSQVCSRDFRWVMQRKLPYLCQCSVTGTTGLRSVVSPDGDKGTPSGDFISPEFTVCCSLSEHFHKAE